MDRELQHHGIKGQKWGRRRFQNADGSLTSAGRQRYAVDIDGAKERVTRAKQKVATLKDRRLRKKALEEIEWEKRKLSDEKVKDKLNGETKPKSKHRLNLEQKYRERGMSAEEAEIAAYKRTRTEKIIAGLAGATIASAAAIVAYKHYKNTVDSVIKPGTLLQNINRDGEDGIKDAFYFSMNKSDNKKYAGLYANQIYFEGNDAYKTQIRVNQALKIAGAKNAKATLSEIISQDPNTASALQQRLGVMAGQMPHPKQNSVVAKAISDLRNGRITKAVHDAANMALTDSPTLKGTDSFRKNFYAALTRKGYDGIIDLNDRKYSGYGAKSPAIAFNAGKKLAIDSINKLSDEQITSDAMKEASKLYAKQVAAQLAATVGGAAISTISKNRMTSRKRDRIVADYRKEHPNTKLSYNEILDNYYSE